MLLCQSDGNCQGLTQSRLGGLQEQQAARAEQEKWEREREMRPRGSQGQIPGPPSLMGAMGGF